MIFFFMAGGSLNQHAAISPTSPVVWGYQFMVPTSPTNRMILPGSFTVAGHDRRIFLMSEVRAHQKFLSI
jgi:hypothetical protein